MKTRFLIPLVCGVCIVWADENFVDQILEYKFRKEINGPYDFRFSTSHGHQREETAELLHEGTEFESIFLKGSYQYLGADGKIYTVRYRADDNGFHPEGDHFEVPPFVPWPSKIDLTKSDGELKDSSDTVNPSKPISLKTIKFLTTQRPPKFEYTVSSTVPSRYLTTPRPFENTGRLANRKSKSFKDFIPSGQPIKVQPSQEYIPTSTRKPLSRGDIVGSSTAKNSRFYSVPKITLEYIPTSSLPPKVKGDIEGTPASSRNVKIPVPQRKKISKYSEIETDITSTTFSPFEKRNKKIEGMEIHPTIIYEGRPQDDAASNNGEDSTVSISQSRQFGSRTKSRKIVENFVTTEYPSRRSRIRNSLFNEREREN